MGDDEFERSTPPLLSESLNGYFHANRNVLDALDKEEKSLPGVWKYLIYGAASLAIFGGAFENGAAAIGFTAIVLGILGNDRDRRKADIDNRRRLEIQNGIIRAVYARQEQILLMVKEARDRRRESVYEQDIHR